MVHAALGDEPALARLVEEQRQRADIGHAEAGVAITVIEALAHLAGGRGREAAELLERAMPETILLGGSRAQQEVFEDSLVAAYIAAGRNTDAAELLRARNDRRPSARDNASLRRMLTTT